MAIKPNRSAKAGVLAAKRHIIRHRQNSDLTPRANSTRMNNLRSKVPDGSDDRYSPSVPNIIQRDDS